MSRRTFLGHAGGLGVAAFAAAMPRSGWSDPLGLPIGIQLWSVNAPLQRNPASTLEALQKTGYRSVETAGFAGLSAAQFRRMLDGAGLVCPSAHLNFSSGDVDSMLADGQALGVHYVVSSTLRLGTGAPPAGPAPTGPLAALLPMTLDDARKTAELANKLGERARKAGMQYAYHNHFFEFVNQGGGAIAYDVLLQETDPALVQFEIDCGWMKVAGYDPTTYLDRYPGRFPMLHVKDFQAVDLKSAGRLSPALRVGAPLGRGSIDYRPIFAAARKAGLKHYFSEQEPPFGSLSELDAAKVSFDYLHSMK